MTLSPLGRDALELEKEFNRLAGFTEKNDELPAFLYDETAPPTCTRAPACVTTSL